MRTTRIFNQTKNVVLAEKACVADTPLSRMKGLLGRAGLVPDEALVLTCCNSIHMLFMKFPIDVIFLDKSNVVVGLVENIPPFHFSPIFWKAKNAVEFPAGTMVKTKTSLGDVVVIS